MLTIKNSIVIGVGSLLLSLLPQSQADAQDKSAVIYNSDGFALTTNFNQPRYPNKDSGAFETTSSLASTGDNKQHFTMSAAPNGSAMIKHNVTGYCLDSTNTLAIAQNTIVWECDDQNPNQHWNFRKISNDKYLINRKDTNLCIDISSNSATVLNTCINDNPSQHFSVTGVNQPLPTKSEFDLDKLEEQIEGLNNQVDILNMLDSSYVVLENGKEVLLTQDDWTYAMKHGGFEKYSKHLKIVNKHGEFLGNASKVLNLADAVVTATQDTYNASADVKSGKLPYIDTASTIAGIGTGMLVTKVLTTSACLAVSAVATPFACVVVVAVVSYGATYAVEEGGKFVFKEVLTKQNMEKVEAAIEPTRNIYVPRKQTEAQFVKNLCKALGGGC